MRFRSVLTLAPVALLALACGSGAAGDEDGTPDDGGTSGSGSSAGGTTSGGASSGGSTSGGSGQGGSAGSVSTGGASGAGVGGGNTAGTGGATGGSGGLGMAGSLIGAGGSGPSGGAGGAFMLGGFGGMGDGGAATGGRVGRGGRSAGGAGGLGTAGSGVAGSGTAGSGVGGSGSSCPATGHVTYTLTKVASPTADQQDAYDRITEAMDKALSYYNCYTNITKAETVQYNPSVETADGSSSGSIRFGGKTYMEYSRAMHEIAHTVGIGTYQEFHDLVVDGIFTGEAATAQLREITGNPSDEVHADTQHFWPGGLNYASEVMSEADLVNHCKLVVAIRLDMGFP